jgi:hypothetical protein
MDTRNPSHPRRMMHSENGSRNSGHRSAMGIIPGLLALYLNFRR